MPVLCGNHEGRRRRGLAPVATGNYPGPLRRVNRTLNIRPHTSPPFLEPRYLAKNSNTFAVRAMPDHELRSAFRRFGVNPALNATAVTLKENRAYHAVHGSRVRPEIRDA
jgi:hypothetical protein